MPAIELRQITVEEAKSSAAFAHAVRLYAEECAISGLPAPRADFEVYKRLQDRGALKVIGALADGAIVGFLALLIAPLPHYSERVATTESFFVLKEYRRKGLGFRLLSLAKQLAKDNGAKGLLVSAPKGSTLAKVLEHSHAFTETNRVFFTRLS